MPLSDNNLWKPAVYKGTTLTELPRPVKQLQLADNWDARESKVPLDDGIELTGFSFNGVLIRLSGQTAIQAGTSKLTEIAMFDLYDSIRDVLNVSSDASDSYEFFIYHDSGTSTYRKFKDCVPRSYSADLGDENNPVFTYSIEVLAQDPTIYQTAEGA